MSSSLSLEDHPVRTLARAVSIALAAMTAVGACPLAWGSTAEAAVATAATAVAASAPVDNLEAADLVVAAVVVTAQRRLERLQEVPVAVTALSGESLLRSDSFKTANDITQLIPNASASATDGRTRPRWFLRGIGTNETAASTVSPIGIYNDDVYLNNVYIQGFPLFDTERVEVLRGPQGTLWGKNTTGGAIHYVSKLPTFSRQGYAKVGLGSFNERQVQGAVGGELVADRLAARVSFFDESRDGWVFNSATGAKDGAVSDQATRVQLLWAVNNDIEAVFSARARRLDGDKSPSFYVLDSQQTVRNPIYRGPLKGREEIAQAGDFGEDLTSDGVSARVSGSLPGGYEFTFITAHDTGRRVLLTGSPIAVDISRSRALADSRQTTQEFRVASPREGRVDWIVGAYFFDESLFSNSVARRDRVAGASGTNTTGASPQSFDITQFNQDTDSQAAFASVNWRLNDAFSLTLGGRYSVERKAFALDFTAAPSTFGFTGLSQWWLPGAVSALNPTRSSSDSATWREFTYDITPQWRVSRDVFAYLRYAHGFRAGGFVVSNTNTITRLEPETLGATELGVKSQWLDGKLTLNAALFNYDYEDIIVGVLLPVPGSNPPVTQQVQENAASGWARGLELELAWAPTTALRVAAQLGLLRTRYDNYQSSASGQTLNATGNRFTRAPETSVGLDVEWRVPLRGGASLSLGGDVSWRSKQFFNAVDQTRATLEQPAYALVNLRAGWRAPDGRVELTAYLRNASDTVYSTLATNTTNGVTRQVYGLPRTTGVSALLRF
jgi:iron complex outermembrane receptor protein